MGSARLVNRGVSTTAWLAGAAALTALAGGCKVGPDYALPDVALHDEWLAAAGVERDPTALARDIEWWRSFNDPALTALVAEAVSQNLSLRVAGLRVLESRARRGIAVGQFFPQTQEAFGGLEGRRLSENEPGGAGDRTFNTASIGLQAAWELDFWGRFRRAIEAADADLLADVANYDATLVALVADVATNYILARSLEERIEIASRNVALQRETLELTETRFSLGAVSELDVVTARATLTNTQAQIPDLRDALRQAKLAMSVLLGRPPSHLDSELGVVAGRGVPEAPAVIAAGVPADLLRRRPDVRAAERVAAAQSARIGVAAADLYPSISIAGSTGFIAGDFDTTPDPELRDLFSSSSFGGFLGLRVNWPILNYGRIENNIRVQDARFEQAVAMYRETVLRAAADVEAGLSAFLFARERAGFLEESVEAARRSVELSLVQYRSGAVDFIRVNEALTVLAQQEDQLSASRASVALGAVNAYRALGGGWEVRADAEFIDAETAARMRERTDWGNVLAPERRGEGGGLFPSPDERFGARGDER